jgi:hypothetical protein
MGEGVSVEKDRLWDPISGLAALAMQLSPYRPSEIKNECEGERQDVFHSSPLFLEGGVGGRQKNREPSFAPAAWTYSANMFMP